MRIKLILPVWDIEKRHCCFILCVQASVPTSGRFSVGQVPGLQSLARATAAPRPIKRRAGA